MSEYVIKNVDTINHKFYIASRQISLDPDEEVDLEGDGSGMFAFARNEILDSRHLRQLIAKGAISILSIVTDADTVRLWVTP